MKKVKERQKVDKQEIHEQTKLDRSPEVCRGMEGSLDYKRMQERRNKRTKTEKQNT